MPAVGAARVRHRRLGPGEQRGVELVAREPAPQQAVGAGDLVVDDLLEGGERLRAQDGPAVDEEARRPPHAELTADRQVVVDARLAGVRVERGAERRQIEPQLDGAQLQRRAFEVALIREQPVVHLPELPLHLGGHGSLGRQRGVVVKGEGVVAKQDPDVVGVVPEQLLERGDHAAAERALEVGELDDRHLRRRRTARRPAERDRDPLDRRAIGDERRPGGAAAGAAATAGGVAFGWGGADAQPIATVRAPMITTLRSFTVRTLSSRDGPIRGKQRARAVRQRARRCRRCRPENRPCVAKWSGAPKRGRSSAPSRRPSVGPSWRPLPGWRSATENRPARSRNGGRRATIGCSTASSILCSRAFRSCARSSLAQPARSLRGRVRASSDGVGRSCARSAAGFRTRSYVVPGSPRCGAMT